MIQTQIQLSHIVFRLQLHLALFKQHVQEISCNATVEKWRDLQGTAKISKWLEEGGRRRRSVFGYVAQLVVYYYASQEPSLAPTLTLSINSFLL